MSNNNKYYYCHIEGNTDVGCKRKSNEDWLDSFECDNGLVAIVCDGMGGHVGGQVASHVAVDAIRNLLSSKYFDNPKEAIVEACYTANSAILQKASEQPELTGMGSTCVMLIVRDGMVYMGSVGDSRIYLVRSKTIRQLTKDQSYVQMLVDSGQITQEQAEHHPRKNEITNALGLVGMQPATVLEDPINPEAGDCFVLCSDGLSGMISDREIAKVVSNQMGMSQQERVNSLIDKARKNGGLDNITCLIVEFSVTPSGSTKPITFKEKLIKYGLPVLISLIIASGLFYYVWNYFRNEKKESEYVAKMRKEAKYVSEEPEDTLIISKDHKDYLEVEEIKNLGMMFYVYHHDGKIDTIPSRVPLSISTLSVYPDENITRKKNGNKYTIKFNSRKYTKSVLSVNFKDKEEKPYCFVFAVKDISSSEEDYSKVISGGAKKKREGQILMDSMVKKQPAEATIIVLRNDTTTIKLKKGSGTNTNKIVYTDYFIDKPNSKSSEWYNYKSDNNECIITIYGPKVPDNDGTIEIPLKDRSVNHYTIRVRSKSK